MGKSRVLCFLTHGVELVTEKWLFVLLDHKCQGVLLINNVIVTV